MDATVKRKARSAKGGRVQPPHPTEPAHESDGAHLELRIWLRLLSSRAALGAATRTVYSATKAGIIGMARTWALELAPFGITVNVVAPGPIADTEMFESVMSPESDRAKALARAIPLGRLGKSSDVARAVSFFSSPDADFITGQTLYVCGGASIGSISI